MRQKRTFGRENKPIRGKLWVDASRLIVIWGGTEGKKGKYENNHIHMDSGKES